MRKAVRRFLTVLVFGALSVAVGLVPTARDLEPNRTRQPVTERLAASVASATSTSGVGRHLRLSCPSKSLCVVVDGVGGTLTSLNPGSTAVSTTADIDGGIPIHGVACPSITLCVAVDGAGDVITSTDPTGGAGAWTSTNIDGTTSLSGVSCPSIALCVAVGGRDVAVSTDPTGGQSAWTVLPAVDQTIGPECGKYAPGDGCAASLATISCPSVSFCVGLDDWGQVVSSTNPRGGVNAWTRGGMAGGPDLGALSCRADSVCVAACPVGFGLLGQNCPGAAYGDGDIVVWNPTNAANALASVNGFSTISSSPVSGVWCPSIAFCLASDSRGDLLGSTDPAGGGSAWSRALADAVPIDDVSCPSPPSCIAIDDAGNVFSTSPPGTAAQAASMQGRASSRRSIPPFHNVAKIHLAGQRSNSRAHTALQRLPSALARRYVIPSGERIPTLGLKTDKLMPASRPDLSKLLGDVGSSAPYGASDPLTRAHARSAAAPAAQFGFATTDGYSANAKFAYCTVNAIPCPTGDLGGWYQVVAGYFPFHYARFFISYDALYYWNSSSGCTWSPAESTGTQVGYADFEQLVWDVQAALAVGLTPEIAFTTGTGVGGVPTVPELSYGTAGSHPWGGWTTAANDYSCGVLGIMAWMGSTGLGSNPVVHWEAWNEPNAATAFNGALNGSCTVAPNPCGGTISPGTYLCYSSSYANCGPLEAAELWVLADAVATGDFPSKGFQVAALTLSDAQNGGYENGYVSQMSDMRPGTCSSGSGYACAGLAPTVWAVHDYDDPSSAVPAAYGDITVFQQDLYNDWGGGQTIWITESAVNITSGTIADKNCSTVNANCGPSISSSCPSNVNISPGVNNKFGGCTELIPEAQATGAYSFVGLATASSFGETITQVDWFEFLPANPSTGWDSGLYSANTGVNGVYASPDGAYVQARYSACALDNTPVADCSASTIDASDWSSQFYAR